MQQQNSTGRNGNQQKMSPLRVRMLADMQARAFHPLTQKAYVRAVMDLVAHCGNRSPEQITLAETQAYLRKLKFNRLT